MMKKNEVQGTVGDSNVMVLSGAALVLDNAANYPGGKPTINNSSSYVVTEIKDYQK